MIYLSDRLLLAALIFSSEQAMSKNPQDDEAFFGPDSLFRRKLHKLRMEWHDPGKSRGHKAQEQLTGFAYITNAENSMKAKDTSEMERLALLDYSTGLYNQQAIIKVFISEVRRAKRYKRPVAIILVECDQFDEVAAGNEIARDSFLKSFSELVLKAVRDVDVPSRYSNSQFLVICPETNSQGARIIAERMLRSISSDALVGVDRNWRITVSVGYASFPKHGTSAQEVITKAEMALQRARTGGGNRCDAAF